LSWFRHVPPAASPITARHVAASLRGAILGGEEVHVAARRALSERYGTERIVLVDSGTSALRIALEVVREAAPARQVALPAYSCYDVATAAVGAGVAVRFYDIDPGTLSPDLDSLRKVLIHGAGSVVVAHLFAYPVDLDGVRALCTEFGVPLVEDAAQGAGGSYRGRRLGTFGDFAILSFGRGKGMAAGGGGALLVHDEGRWAPVAGVVDRLRRGSRGFAECAALAGQWLFGRPSLYWIPASVPVLRLGETVYHEPWEPGGMATGVAATVPAVLAEVDGAAAGRRCTARELSDAFAGSEVRLVWVVPGAEPGYLRFPVIGGGSWVRHGSVRRAGVERSYPEQLSKLRPLEGRASGQAEQPGLRGCSVLARGLVTLPTHRWIAEHHLPRMIAAVRGTLN